MCGVKERIFDLALVSRFSLAWPRRRGIAGLINVLSINNSPLSCGNQFLSHTAASPKDRELGAFLGPSALRQKQTKTR